LGAISDKINEMINRILESAEWTSANPTHINTLIQVNALENPDFEHDIKQLVKNSPEGKEFTKMKKGNMGEINRMTNQQFGNIKEFATNPAGFIFSAFIKKFTRGVGIIAFAIIIFEAVKWIISELLKPGRLLDIRWKRDFDREIMAFRRREDQQKIRQGFSNIIITTMPGLRGGYNQTVNTQDMVRDKSIPQNLGWSANTSMASGVSRSKSKGGRFPGSSR